MPETESFCLVLEDESGKETEYEIIGTFTLEDRDYIALLPVENPEEGALLLRFHAGPQDQILMDPILDDGEYENASKAFDDIFNGRIPTDLLVPDEQYQDQEMIEEKRNES